MNDGDFSLSLSPVLYVWRRLVIYEIESDLFFGLYYLGISVITWVSLLHQFCISGVNMFQGIKKLMQVRREYLVCNMA